MYLLWNQSTDAAFNLALEEYLLGTFRQEILVLWRNAPSVIIGRNQNAMEEIDLDYVDKNEIRVIRRQSGGGAVFHDLGNINFTMITPLVEGDFDNYAKFTTPIIDFLTTLGIKGELRGRNDLVVGDAKFSGNAQAIKNGWIMHHGTLLYEADFTHLSGALKPSKAKLDSKGIRSVRSRVTNISSLMENHPPVEEFLTQLYDFFRRQEGMVPYELTLEDKEETRKLVEEKYGLWQWNMGDSPAYNYAKTEHLPFGTMELKLQVDKGMIKGAQLQGDFFSKKDTSILTQKFVGLLHKPDEILGKLKTLSLDDYFTDLSEDDFLRVFF